MPSPQCVTCKFFDSARNPDWGNCRRYAPRPMWTDDSDIDRMPQFPLVRNSDWCGEYETDSEFLAQDEGDEQV